MLKSAVKKKNDLTPPVGQTSPACSNVKSTESENLPFDDFDDTPFVFPPDNKCFCCGDKRIRKKLIEISKLSFINFRSNFFRTDDFELVGEDFERAKSVLEEVLSYDLHIKRSSAKQWSPISTPVPEPAFIFDHDTEAAPGPVSIPSLEQEDISLVESDLSDTDSILDVPEYDFNFSSEIDSSIITDW